MPFLPTYPVKITVKKRLLFVTYGGGHAHMVYPVVHALRKSREFALGDIEMRILGLPAAKETLKQHNVDCMGFRHYLDEEKDADAIRWGKALAQHHHSSTIGVDLEDSIAYLGLSYKDLVVRLGEAEAARQFEEKSRHAFYPLTVMERIFDDIRPDFVITSNSPRSEAAAIEIANRRGIGSLIMTDLFTGLGGYRLQARNITFLNEFAIQKFIEDGLVDEKISTFYCTGNPAFDKILELPTGRDPGWMHRHFPQAEGKPVLLHADMPAYWDTVKHCTHIRSEAEIMEELDACYNAAAHNGAVYLVRPHPSQDRSLYVGWLEGKKNAWLAADCDLHSLLRNIDLLLARTTTVGLEAAYMRKKVLQLDCDFHTDMPLAKMGIAWGVNSNDELSGMVKNALMDDKKLDVIGNKVKQLLPGEPAAAKIANIVLEKIRPAVM